MKEAALLSAKHHSKSKSGSRQSVAKLQPPKDQQQNDKDQEIMNDLMTDIVQLRHRLSTQLQVAPFLTGSSANIPGSRKSSVSKLKDIEVKINKGVLDGTTLESTDTIDILDKLARQPDSIPASRTNSESKLLENHATKEQSSLENIVIEVPKLPMVQQNAQRQQQAFNTTCIPKIKRSRTFSDIREISNSSCSSKEIQIQVYMIFTDVGLWIKCKNMHPLHLPCPSDLPITCYFHQSQNTAKITTKKG